MHGSTTWLQHRRAGEDDGFTLIELLVVITILGILAAIVVFAVKGIGDKGQSAAIKADAATIRTAEEAYCAQNGTYGDPVTDLQPGFLQGTPKYNSVVLTAGGSCGSGPHSGFVIGSASFTSTTGASFLGASNTTPPFSFLLSSFIDTNGAAKFTFGASGGFATQVTTAGDTSALFASADEANVNKTIANGTAAVGTGEGAPAGATGATSGTVGKCTAAVCPGMASSKVEYTTGRLVAFSCKSAGRTLAPAQGAPTCKAPAAGYPAATASVQDLANALLGNPALKLAIADPGTAFTLATCAISSAPPTAPYGVAAVQSLLAPTASGGGGLTCAQYNTLVSNGQVITGPGNNVTLTQNAVVSGAADYALIPKSFVKSPSGDDTDNWFTVPQTAHTPIRQWAVVLSSASAADRALAQKFIDYVTSPSGQAVLAQFGYDPIS